MTTTLRQPAERNALLQLLGLSLLVRLIFLLAVPRVLDTADAIHYVETAARLAGGDFLGVDPKIPVLYPALGALAGILVTDLEWACRLVSFAASVLTVIPVFFLARDLHGLSAARCAGTLVALWPWLADYACTVSTEATAVFLWLAGVWLFTRGIRQGGPALYGSAIALIALSLTRPEGLFILLATAPAALILLWKPDRTGCLRYARFAALAGALVLANGVYVRLLTGAATASYRAGFILEEFDFHRFAQTAIEMSSNVIPIMLGPLLLPFFGVGLFHPRTETRDPRLEGAVLLLAGAQFAVSLFVLSPAPRYLMAPLIILALWAAAGIVLAAREIATWRPGCTCVTRLPYLLVFLFFAAHACITVGAEHLGRRPREPREYKEAGRWMAEHLAPGLIFTRKPQVGFYAAMPSTGPALNDSLEQALARAREAGAAYVVVDERYTASMVPALGPLLDDAFTHEALERLHTLDTYPDARVAIYVLRNVPAHAAP